MLNFQLKIGILSIRRYIKEPPKRIGAFQSDYAVENKNVCIEYIRKHYTDDQTQFVDLEWLNSEGLLYLDEDCERVVEYFRAEHINALFIINCNFGEESCAGRVAAALHVPTLLWGPRDHDFSNLVRYTDTQCGLFSVSKQLRRNNVKFSYIENCDIHSPAFDEGLRCFFRVACMVNNFRNMRILQVGARVKPFKCVMYNELALCEQFGIDIVSLNLADAVNRMTAIREKQSKRLQSELALLQRIYDCAGCDDETLIRMLCVKLYFEEISKQYNSNIITTECWTGINVGWGVNPCLAMSLLADEGIYVACEWDVHMAITNTILLAASRGTRQPLQGEFTCRHPENENGELLWHCGPFPASCCAKNQKPKLYGGKPCFRAEDGTYTLARFQTDRDKYYLLCGKFHTCTGPETSGTYLWAEFDNLPKLERKLIEGPYIHHATEIFGDYTKELREFADYTGIILDTFGEE